VGAIAYAAGAGRLQALQGTGHGEVVLLAEGGAIDNVHFAMQRHYPGPAIIQP